MHDSDQDFELVRHLRDFRLVKRRFCCVPNDRTYMHALYMYISEASIRRQMRLSKLDSMAPTCQRVYYLMS